MASFSEAFAAARRAGKKEFTWNGKRYHTRTKEEEAQRKSPPTPPRIGRDPTGPASGMEPGRPRARTSPPTPPRRPGPPTPPRRPAPPTPPRRPTNVGDGAGSRAIEEGNERRNAGTRARGDQARSIAEQNRERFTRGSAMKKGGAVKGFKPCASCKAPAKCKAAGKCLAKK